MIRSPEKRRLLVSINGNIPEWRACFLQSGDCPRLPLPYAFGAALVAEGFGLYALDLSDEVGKQDKAPFCEVFPSDAFAAAYAATDYLVGWGRHAVKACIRDAWVPRARRKTIMLCYAWQSLGPMSRQTTLLLTRRAARFARAVIFMSHSQVVAGRLALPESIPVLRLRVGIDTAYYRKRGSDCDVPEEHRGTVDTLHKAPYLVLPGDELRLHEDLLQLAAEAGVTVVRISQYADKSGTNSLKARIEHRKLQDRVVVFERISYRFLRYLLQHAAAFAGLIDGSWQPAGWTAMCESLASGTPVIAYSGLTTGELQHLGATPEIVKIVAAGDRDAFAHAVHNHLEKPLPVDIRRQATDFAARALDLHITAPAFARDFRSALQCLPSS